MAAKVQVNADRQQYLSQLTSLRGIACMIVLLGHVVQIFRYQYTYDSPFQSLVRATITSAFNAEGAVLLFFVLSGCVLSLSLKNVPSLDPRSTIAFYVKRIFRIYPLLWFAIGLAMISMLVARHLAEAPVFIGWLASNLTTAINAKHTILSVTGMYTRYNGPMWSLRVELIYSAFFPAIFLLMRNVWTRNWALGAFAVLAVAPLPHLLGFSYGLSFALGALIPLLSIRHTRWRGGIALVAVIILLYDRIILTGMHPPARVFDFIETIAAFFIVRDIYASAGSYRFLVARPVVWLGELSYGIYLIHFPILLIVFTGLTYWFTPSAMLDHPTVAQIALVILTSAITIPMAAMSYNFIELPFHNIGRKLGKKVALRSGSEHVRASGTAISTRPASS